MSPHAIFFIGALSILSGIAYASLGLPLLYSLVPAAVAFSVLYNSNIDARIAIMSAFLIVSGSAYYALDDHAYRYTLEHLPESGPLEGSIVNDPRRSDMQSFYLKTSSGTILVETSESIYKYGDVLRVEGAVKTPPNSYYGRYLAKERVAGIMRNPKIARLAWNGSPVLSFLFGVKGRVRDLYGEYLGKEEAAFLSGITLGTNEDFSEQFTKNLSLSGTRHLTAISGSNMSIIIFVIFGMALYVLPRRSAVLLTFLFVCCFVAAIGFTVSAMRAALMAGIVMLARESGRIYAPHLALTLAALLLTLQNPKVLLFDLGFQLSFLAVIAIIYVAPVVQWLLRLGNTPGFLDWRGTLAMTISAQVMTAPILITQFQTFSLTAVVTNMLILAVIPLAMIAGFCMALLSFVSVNLARIVSLVVTPLIDYCIFIINAGAKFALLFNPNLGFAGITLYYAALAAILYWFYQIRSSSVETPAIKTNPTGFEIVEII